MKEPTRMSDLELTKACAEAMEYIPMQAPSGVLTVIDGSHEFTYQPLHDDAQAMALVKRFSLRMIRVSGDLIEWSVGAGGVGPLGSHAMNADLNRAIVECVAKMQEAKPA